MERWGRGEINKYRYRYRYRYRYIDNDDLNNIKQ
jgi:hypothetical protein